MLEITKKNCNKCDLETIIDKNSQYFWINVRDFEVETEIKWFNIFNKQGNKSTLNYRRKLTPNIKFQADRIFVRNDLFEQVIKSCKATSTEFLMFKEKLGLCLYGELIEEIFEKSNEKSTKDLIKESDNESNQKLAKKLTKELIKKLDEYSDGEPDEMFKESGEESDNESTKKLTKELIKNR